MSNQISSFYADQGYFAPLPAIASDQAADIVARIDAFKRCNPSEASKAFANNAHLLFPWLYDLVVNETILDHVQAAIGPNILAWTTNFFTKQPGDGGFVSWHQDSTYWVLDPADIVTAWLALTPSTQERGCMRVVRRTHLEGQLDHQDTPDGENLLSRGQVVARDVRDEDVVDLVLAPGEMSLHHVRIVHGSEPNLADQPRIGFVIRYIPTYCRQIGARSYGLLVRGEDTHGHFDTPPRPRSDYDAAARAIQQDASARLRPVMYDGAN
jgi:non-heme Fe2+,alpha-ketoglutarate-dependent halogenase